MDDLRLCFFYTIQGIGTRRDRQGYHVSVYSFRTPIRDCLDGVVRVLDRIEDPFFGQLNNTILVRAVRVVFP